MRTSHTVFMPVYGLQIGPLMRGEIKVGRVTFIDAKKIARVHKRLGIAKLTEYQDGQSYFSNASTYAVVRCMLSETDTDILQAERQLIKRTFWIFASSFSHKQRRGISLSLTTRTSSNSMQDIFVFRNSSSDAVRCYRLTAPLGPNQCDGFWKMNAKHKHFNKLQKIMSQDISVDPSWRKSIECAAEMRGRSLLASSMSDAFMYNMIGIETLLTRKGDKFPESLIQRLVALFGWLHGEDDGEGPWAEIINRLYPLRCEFVHDGLSHKVTGQDVLDSDTLLDNLLTNVCNHTKRIPNKNGIATLADKLSAMKTLGIKPKRNINFSFSYPVNPKLSDYEDDYLWGGK